MNSPWFRSAVAVSLVLSLWAFPCLSSDYDPESLSSASFVVVGTGGERFEASFSSVQEAINQAENGSIIHVPSGTYYEHLLVNKSVSLFGEEELKTVIDGSGTGSVVEITADDVMIAFLRLQNSGYGWSRHGVYIDTADNCTIRNNLFTNDCHTIKLNYSRNSQVTDNRINGTMTSPTMYGIRIENSTNCTVTGNDVSDCVGAIHLQNATDCVVRNNIVHGNSQGIRFYSPCTYNKVAKNMVHNNTYDGMVSTMPGNATFFSNQISHNDFIDNTNPFIIGVTGFTWDSGYPSGGNYWSRYNGTDMCRGLFQNETGSDGVGDMQYIVAGNNVDRYPLVYEWSALPVHNIDKGTSYNHIQEALEAPETVNGNTIFADDGIYEEHLVLNKSVSLIGENQKATIIDGKNSGTVLTVKADGVTVSGFTVKDSGSMFPPYGNDCGILLDHCAGVNLSHNTVTHSRIGIYLYYSEGNAIEQNTVHSNTENGILLWHSGKNRMSENIMVNNTRNFGVFGQEFRHFDNSVEQSNTADGKPVYYLVEIRDLLIENRTDVGALYLVNCANVTVRNMNLLNNSHGVFCFNVTDCRMENITSSHNGYGIALQNSASNVVSRNRLIDDWVGLVLEGSDTNDVEENMILGGEKGISLYEADNNTIVGNTIMNAFFGIRMYASSLNRVIHNNIVENSVQVSVLASSHENAWDNGIEGNYWSDYSGQDVNRDGVGDEQYAIDTLNNDTCPLFGRFHAFTVSHEGKSYRVGVITNSTVLSFAFDELSTTIRLTVNGSEQAFGFCRICIPHILIEPELTVVIDGGLTQVLYANYTALDDGFNRWIYFVYQHSSHEIVIIPEFHALIILLFVSASLFLLVFGKDEQNHRTLKQV